MSRGSVGRKWTDDERELARRIAEAVASWEPGDLVGTASLVRAVGLPYSRKVLQRNVARVRDVMPLVATIVRQVYPGFVLCVERQGRGRMSCYRLRSSSDPLAMRGPAAGIAKSHTVMTRVADTVPRDFPSGSAVARYVDGVLGLLSPDILDALLAAAAAERATVEGGDEPPRLGRAS